VLEVYSARSQERATATGASEETPGEIGRISRKIASLRLTDESVKLAVIHVNLQTGAPEPSTPKGREAAADDGKQQEQRQWARLRISQCTRTCIFYEQQGDASATDHERARTSGSKSRHADTRRNARDNARGNDKYSPSSVRVSLEEIEAARIGRTANMSTPERRSSQSYSPRQQDDRKW